MTPEQEAHVVAHDGLACRYASAFLRHLPPHIERDDLIQAARVGLCAAALRWRPETGVPFEAYAKIRLRGAILDALRCNRGVSSYTALEDGRRRPRRYAPVDQLDGGFDVAEPATDYDRAILVDQVLARLDDLERREAFTVRAHVAGHTLRAISAALGLSESRACQFYKAATQRLRRELASN